MFSGLLIGLVGGLANTEPVEEVHWSWRRLSIGIMGGLLYGLIAALVLSLDLSPTGGWEIAVLATGLIFGLFLGVFFGLVPGLADNRSTPNEGIHRSARHGMAVGLAIGLIVGLTSGPKDGLIQGLYLGLLFGLLFGGAACLRHLVLRTLLAYNDFAPLRYRRFLDAATERLLLRRVGSSYIFAHRLLFEHLAELDTSLPAAVQRSNLRRRKLSLQIPAGQTRSRFQIGGPLSTSATRPVSEWTIADSSL